VPVFGKLVAAIRSLWNSISTKWYVRPLIQQQTVFNSQVVRYLKALQSQLDQLRPLSPAVERLGLTVEQTGQDVEQLDLTVGQVGRAVEQLGLTVGQIGRAVEQLGLTVGQIGQAVERLGLTVEQTGQDVEQLGRATEHQSRMSGWLSCRVDQLEIGSHEQGRLLQGQLRDAAENIRELTVLAEHVAALKERLAAVTLERSDSGREET
jgi:methyl-accepting chemotaxis protein